MKQDRLLSKLPLPPDESEILASFPAIEAVDLSGFEKGRFEAVCDGVNFPFYFRRAAPKRLFIHLCGAVNRKTMTLPMFARRAWWPLMPGSTLCISDPTLELSGDISLGWYIGTKEKDFTLLMARLIDRIATQMGLARSDIVFYASSGGGFASLMCARHLPGANCIVVNPQVDVALYGRTHRRRLASIFAPDQKFKRMLRQHGERFSLFKAFPDADSLPPTIYAQNRLDQHHLTQHYEVFCETYSAPKEGGMSTNGRVSTLIFESDRGHGPEPRHLVRPLIEQGLAFFETFKSK